MTYTPINISTKDFETDEKVLKPELVKTNLNLIAAETKLLNSKVENVRATVISLETKTEPKMTPIVAALLFG